MGFLLWLTQFLSLILFHFHFHSTFSSSFSSTPVCAHDQSLALLQFKRSFSIDTFLQLTRYSNYLEMCQDQYPKTESWKDGTDCCMWDGVTCDMKTGQVTGLDLSCSMLYGPLHSNNTLFSLYHLQKLDLSGNDFNSSHISSQFGHLSNLTHLSLNYSGFAGQVPPKLSLLSKLVSLHLSFNENLAIEPIVFDNLVHNLTKLRELHLNWVNMSSVVPRSLMNLSSSLSSLKLSGCGLQGKLPDNLLQRPILQLLHLWSNYDLTGSFPPFNVSVAFSSLDLSSTGISIHLEHDSINNLKSVKILHLSECNFVGSNLAPLGNLTQLTELDLSFNQFSGHIPLSLGKLKHLQHLNLGYNNFTGPIPYDFEQRTELVSLDLSSNTYLTLDSSSFNELVQNLTKLRELYLGYVNMSLVEPNSLTNLSSSLSYLSLWSCGLRGKFPSNIFLLPNLEFLYLNGNVGLTGSFPSSNVSSVLKGLDISDTRISVYLENDFIRNLKSLEYLYLSNCNITKRSNLVMLGNLTLLISLDLSFNNFSGQIPSSFGNIVKLNSLYLGSNNFTGPIPDFLGNLAQLEYLNLSDNQLLGPIPSGKSSFPNLFFLRLSDNLLNGTIPSFLFSHPSLSYLNLRDNLFTGNLSKFQSNSLEWLDLSNNHLHGPISSSIFNEENLRVLNLASNNKLTGEISSSICKLTSLAVLDLSNNSLSGFIPQCLWNLTDNLSVLHLGMNNLEGTIPAKFSIGNSLGYLNLNGNKLEGKIPPSIVNCTRLEVPDLGNNKIEDKFPYFLERLQQLQILVLKSNKLHGFVKGPTTNNSFPKLRIFDVSSNNLSGELPKRYFNNLEAMMSFNQNMIYMRSSEFIYDYSVRMTWKGLEMEFVKIRNTLTSIDLSDNNFTGEIPESIGKLKALGQLNFSHNSFTGYIQPSLGNLTNLESLDLSSNLLTGRIPIQLADLTFLSVLNLSHNRLNGPIPKGKQFNTFNNDSFEGNLGLCGFPISKECNNSETQQLAPSSAEEGDESILFRDGFGWKAIAIGYGCGFVFGVTVGYIMLRTRKPIWFEKVVQGQWNLKTRRRKKNVRGNGVRRN